MLVIERECFPCGGLSARRAMATASDVRYCSTMPSMRSFHVFSAERSCRSCRTSKTILLLWLASHALNARRWIFASRSTMTPCALLARLCTRHHMRRIPGYPGGGRTFSCPRRVFHCLKAPRTTRRLSRSFVLRRSALFDTQS